MQPFVVVIIVLVIALALSTIFATVLFSRFKFRTHKRLRSLPVDKANEAKMRAQAAVAAYEYDQAASGQPTVLGSNEANTVSRPPSYIEKLDSTRKSILGGYYGLTPVSQAGPGGTRTYLNGWFGLDAPDAGSNESGIRTNTTTHAPVETSLDASRLDIADDSAMGETQFSRATRASLRRSKQAGD
ncbi:hypothetical protein OIV83_000901 [Microbotryomycetes sp. JL201]|nr:hypothetical protein OIV83_000901 [Microbotryomycetes sp. JL201]